MKIRLERTPDLMQFSKLLHRRVFDDPRYMLFFDSDTYSDLKEDGCWVNDAFGIMLGDECVGVIAWNISRYNDTMYSVSVLVSPEHLHSGAGAAAMVLWLDYQMNYRKARKITFSCTDGNPVKRIYDKLLDCGGKYVGCREKQSRTMDHEYHNVHMYEILGEKFFPSKLFSRALKHYK